MSVHDDPPPSSFTGLPSIPQLPPITLPATPSMESFTTALSSTSADDGMRHIGTHDHQRYAAPHALTASSSMSSLASPVSPRSRSGSANASQDHSRLQPPATSDISDLSDFENTSLNVAPSRQRQSGTASSVAGTDDRNRNTPTPTYYTKNTERSRAGGSNSSGQASGSQGIEQHRRKLVNRWDSEREDPAYNSATAATRYNNTSGSSNGHAQGISRGATQRDSHASFPVPPLLRAKLSLSSAHLRGATTTSSKALRSTNSTFPLSSSSSASGPTRNARSPTIPNSKREAAALLPPIPMPPPPSSSALLNRPLPSIPAGNGTGSTKGMDRMRSASLLEIMNSATGRSSSSTSGVPATHSASPKDSKPRLTLQSATSSTSRAVSLVVPEFSILVVGAPKSGKSTLISKGLKPWSLESEKTIVLGTYHGPTSSSGASSSSSTYPHELVAISRIAHVAIKSGTFAVEVIEVSSQELIRCGGDWPQVIGTGSNHTGVGWGAGKGKEKETTLMDCATGRTVDGLVVCYDANDGESWKTAKVLLGHASLSYVGLPIQAIVVACKSDTVTPPVPANHTTFHPILSVQSMEADKYHIGLGIHPTHRHPPGGSTAPGHHSKPSADSDEITERGGAGSGRHSISTASVPGGGMMDPVHKNLGLVSVSGRTVEGKKKMRDAFNWLFRRIERGKKNWASSHQPRSERGVPQGFEMSGRDSALSYNPSSAPNRSAAQSPVSPATTTTPVGGGSPRSPLSAALSSPSTSGSGRRSVLKTLQSPIASNSSRARSTSDLVSDLVGGSGRESGTEKERSDREMRSGYGSGSGTGGGASDGMRKSVLRSRAGSVGAYLGAPPPNPAGLVALPPPPPFPPPEPRDSSPGSSEPRPRKSSGSRVSAGPGAYTSTSSGNDRASQGSNRAASQSMDELGSTSRRGSMHHLAPPGSLDVGTSQAAPPANITMNTILRTVKEPPPLQYATLDELIDKLVFLAVTDDDPVFVEQFLLVYRRFATPRALLLGLQKRIRALSSPSEDQLLAKFAQMRVCALLEDWMMTYPGDFASPGAEPALQAIVRQILSNSHTAHYAVDFVPFLKCVPKLVDEDKDWAAKGKTRDCEDDGPNSDVDPAEADVQVDPNDLGVAIQTPPRDPDIAGDGSIPGRVSGSPATPPVTVQVTGTSDPRDLATESHDSLSQTLATSQQDGASSIGLETHLKQASASSTQLDSSPQNMAKEVASSNGSVRFRAVSMNASEVQPIPEALVPWFADMGTMSSASRGPKGPDAPPGTKANLKELKNASNALAQMDPTWVGQEITRLEVPLFRAVQPRDWLRHGTSEAPGTRMDPVLRMARFYNYLSMWTTSLIVVHDKARHQCKTIEIFTKIAWALRKLNNYSGLRAVVTGINNSKPDNSPVSEMLAAKPEWVKSFKVLEVLLGTARMHGSYRMALKNTPDAAIVSMEVHSYDLVRADDVNPDHRPGDPTQIHWGKFSLIAKMILSVVTFQRRFEDTAAFSFPERPDIRELIVGVVVMDEETVWARHALLAEPHATAQGQSDTGGASSTNRFKQIFARGK